DDVLASFRRHDDNSGTSVRAVQWAEDAIHLLDVIERELPQRRQELHELGNTYLCEKCYRVASTVADPLSRWRSYHQINEMFAGAVSPLAYELRRYQRLLKGVLRRGARTIMGRG